MAQGDTDNRCTQDPQTESSWTARCGPVRTSTSPSTPTLRCATSSSSPRPPPPVQAVPLRPPLSTWSTSKTGRWARRSPWSGSDSEPLHEAPPDDRDLRQQARHPDLAPAGPSASATSSRTVFASGLTASRCSTRPPAEYPRERSDERFLGGTGFVGFHYKGFYAEAEAGAGVRFREMPDTVSHASTWTMAFTLGTSSRSPLTIQSSRPDRKVDTADGFGGRAYTVHARPSFLHCFYESK